MAGVGLAAGAAALPLSKQLAMAAGGEVVPGTPKPWHAPQGIYGGTANLSTGNALIAVPICGWGGKGLSFGIAFNSHSTRTSALGAK